MPSEFIDNEFEDEEADDGVGDGCDSCEFDDIVDAIEERVVAA